MRLVFLGSPPDAVPALRALHDAGEDIAFVVTQPDRRRSRGPGVTPTAVKTAAQELGLPVRTPARADDVADELHAAKVDAGVVVAFGQLLRPALLASVPLGFVNVHYSLLPRWRGAAPVERAILAGDAETGVAIMRIEEGLDTGPVYASIRTPIDEYETAGDLRARLSGLSTPLLLDVVRRLGELTPEPQQGEPTYADKLTVEEFRLDPARPAAELARVVRAGNPHPGAWLDVGGRRVKVLRAHAAADDDTAAVGTLTTPGRLRTSDGTLVLEAVQPAGKAAMPVSSWMNGLRERSVTIDPVPTEQP